MCPVAFVCIADGLKRVLKQKVSVESGNLHYMWSWKQPILISTHKFIYTSPFKHTAKQNAEASQESQFKHI